MAKFVHILYDKIVFAIVWLVGSVMLVCILLQIFTRTFFKVPFPWTDELARFTFLWFCFSGSVLTLRKKLHLGIDYFEGKMPQKLKFANRVFVYSLIILFGIFITVLGAQLLEIVSGQVSPIIRMPMVLVYIALPLMGILYIILGLYQLLGHITGNEEEAPQLTDVPADVVEKGAQALKGGSR
jgi:TRAP-type C4-dicarboxylate transport system permease small subunit